MKTIYRKHFTLIILLLIFLIGFTLRFILLDKIPNGLHIDEAINGVNANSILQTGKDTNNTWFPLQTEVFGDYNPTGYSYLAIIPIKIFGLTEFATRFPGALLGSLTILALYLLSYSIFKDKKISLLSAFLLAINPWHVVLSRSSEETLVSLFFVVLGFALIFFSIRNQRIKLLILGVLILIISYFTYFTPRVFIPLLMLVILIYGYNFLRKNNKYFKSIICSILILMITAFCLVFVVKGGENRLNQVSIFGSLGTKLIMQEQIREDGIQGTNVRITQFFHNKIVNPSLTYISNYLNYFSGDFLLMKGGLPIWFNVEGMGLIYLTELPFILIGLVVLAKEKDKAYKIPLLWLFIAPVAAAITIDDIPNMRRSLLMLPALEMISAFGFLYIIRNRKKITKLLMICISAAILMCNFSYFIHQFFIHMPVHKNYYRNEGFGKMVNVVSKYYNSIDNVIVTKSAGGIYPLILFYAKYNPALYQKEGSPKDKDYVGFGKFFFVPQACPSVNKDNRFPRGKVIYVDNGTCPDNGVLDNKKGTVINRQDGTRVFRIIYD
jgi:4-amino-4-deoxy-L-arabinose transferase-like glycosyltransferase